jgi:hypothetical protein
MGCRSTIDARMLEDTRRKYPHGFDRDGNNTASLPPPSAKTITPLNQLASAVGEYSPRLLQAEGIVPTSRDELGIGVRGRRST